MRPLPQLINAACMIVAFSLQAWAQDPSVGASPTVFKDSLITVLPSRTPNEITADIEKAKTLLAQAEARRMLAQSALSYTTARIELKKKEIDVIDKRIDIAEDAKKESEAVSLKAELEVAKKLLDILKSQSSVREAEIDAATAEYDHAGAWQIALELEQELRKRRAENAATSSAGGVGQMGVNQMIDDLIAKTLDAQLEAAKKEQKISDRKRDLAGLRVKLHELQRMFTVGSK
jgi:hypothetical protein